MLGKISFWKKPMLMANIEDCANMLNKACAKNKKLALSWFYRAKLDKNVTSNFLRKVIPTDSFDQNGRMSANLRKKFKIDMKFLGLKPAATIKEYFNASKANGFSFLKY